MKLATPTISSVAADPRRRTLSLAWSDGSRTTKDMKPLLKRRGAFAPLAASRRFMSVEVSERGGAVEWPGTDIAIDRHALWFDAHPQDNPFDDATLPASCFRGWMKAHGLSLSTAAGYLGISRRQAAYYASGEKVAPKVVWLACAAFEGHREALAALRKRAA